MMIWWKMLMEFVFLYAKMLGMKLASLYFFTYDFFKRNMLIFPEGGAHRSQRSASVWVDSEG